MAALIFSISPLVRADMLSIYAAQGMDTNLPNLPGRVVTNDLTFEKSYFSGTSYINNVQTPEIVNTMARFVGATSASSSVEFILVKHHGMQENYETDLAYFVQLPPGDIGALSLRFGVAVGLSYAFGTPTYEDGPEGDPEKRYRLQNFNAYELEWHHRKIKEAALVTRIHHRSGAYGLIAPRHVGSNFLSIGLRFNLD